NAVRCDLMVSNFIAAYYYDLANNLTPPSSPFTVPCTFNGSTPVAVDASLMNFFRPSGLNPSIAAPMLQFGGAGGAACVGYGQSILSGLKSQGFNASCDPVTVYKLF